MSNDSKKTVWVLVGEGANNLSIPCLVWADGDAALAQCKEMLGEPKSAKNEKYYWNLPEMDYGNCETEEEAEAGFATTPFGKLFTHYYDGCGGCDSVVLKEVEQGKPFVGWDLD